MLFLPFITLFSWVTAALPLESSPLAEHPSIKTLHKFGTQVSALTDEIKAWDGRPNGMRSIVEHSRETCGTLRLAANQMRDSEGIDFFASALGFGSAGLSINGKANTFSTVVQSKLPEFKAIRQQQTMFELLDSCFLAGTDYFNASKAKMPSIVYEMMKPYHSQVLGTLAQAREAFRPGQEVVIIVMPGNPPISYTLPPGAPIPTAIPSMPIPSYPQYTSVPSYPPDYLYSNGQYGQARDEAQYTQVPSHSKGSPWANSKPSSPWSQSRYTTVASRSTGVSERPWTDGQSRPDAPPPRGYSPGNPWSTGQSGRDNYSPGNPWTSSQSGRDNYSPGNPWTSSQSGRDNYSPGNPRSNGQSGRDNYSPGNPWTSASQGPYDGPYNTPSTPDIPGPPGYSQNNPWTAPIQDSFNTPSTPIIPEPLGYSPNNPWTSPSQDPFYTPSTPEIPEPVGSSPNNPWTTPSQDPYYTPSTPDILEPVGYSPNNPWSTPSQDPFSTPSTPTIDFVR